jgi:hypothetical protein
MAPYEDDDEPLVVPQTQEELIAADLAQYGPGPFFAANAAAVAAVAIPFDLPALVPIADYEIEDLN